MAFPRIQHTHTTYIRIIFFFTTYASIFIFFLLSCVHFGYIYKFWFSRFFFHLLLLLHSQNIITHFHWFSFCSTFSILLFQRNHGLHLKVYSFRLLRRNLMEYMNANMCGNFTLEIPVYKARHMWSGSFLWMKYSDTTKEKYTENILKSPSGPPLIVRHEDSGAEK